MTAFFSGPLMVIIVSWSSFKIPKIITSFPLKFVSILILFSEISKYASGTALFENKIIIISVAILNLLKLIYILSSP